MPAPRTKAHQLPSFVPEKTVLIDSRKQQFIVGKQLAVGGFGRIYTAKQESSSEYGKANSLVVKIEPHGNGPLFTEIAVFQRILKPEMLEKWKEQKALEHLGLPPFISTGLYVQDGERLRFLIMPKYDKCLEEIRVARNGKFEVDTVVTIARQCADCLDYMQYNNYVHADIKAGNILLKAPNSFSKCYLVDLGLARMIRGCVEKPEKSKAHNGTLIFTSLDAHRGCVPSYRGDLEILSYNILFWLSGALPWENIEDAEKVFKEKQKFAADVESYVKKMVPGEVGILLGKLFKLSYGTPYATKVNYAPVHLIFCGMTRALSSTTAANKKPEKAVPTKRRTRREQEENKGEQRAPSLAPKRVTRKRKNDATSEANKASQVGQAKKVGREASGVKTKPLAPDQIEAEDGDGTVSNETVQVPNAKRRKPATTKSSKMPKPSTTKSAKLRKPATSTSRRLPRRSARLRQKSSPMSPESKLRQMIPGMRGMNIRKSLQGRLAKKYLGVEGDSAANN